VRAISALGAPPHDLNILRTEHTARRNLAGPAQDPGATGAPRPAHATQEIGNGPVSVRTFDIIEDIFD